MSYLVLARKYRPRTLGEIAGQEVVKATLRGALQEGRVAHAYLFSGPRGTGKTTTARALAKSLNCERGPTPEPCGACERCLALDAGAEADVVEIDAATHTGVDHVRELRDQTAYMPMRARFKIYIVDEVHMLSRGAFNALLKTLEEPPAHVKFFFATTEPYRVPETVRSRCQLLRLEPLAEQEIEAHLATVLAKEGVHPEEGVTRELARRARGGMRDALSLADQLLALVGLEPRVADLERLSGEGGSSALERILERVEAQDRAGVLSALPAARGDEAVLVERLIELVRAALLVSLCGEEHPLAPAEPSEREAARERGRRLGPERLELWLEELLEARRRSEDLPAHARTALELALLGLCDPARSLPLSELAQRLEALEARLAAGANAPAAPPAPRASQSAPRAAAPPAPAPPRREPSADDLLVPVAREPRASAPPPQRPPPQQQQQPTAETRSAPAPGAGGARSAPRARRGSAAEAWKLFLESLRAKAPSLAEVLGLRAKLVEWIGGRAVVQLQRLHEGERALLEEPRNRRICNEAFGEIAGEPVEVVLDDVDRRRPGRDDPFTSKVADLFGGRIEEGA